MASDRTWIPVDSPCETRFFVKLAERPGFGRKSARQRREFRGGVVDTLCFIMTGAHWFTVVTVVRGFILLWVVGYCGMFELLSQTGQVWRYSSIRGSFSAVRTSFRNRNGRLDVLSVFQSWNPVADSADFFVDLQHSHFQCCSCSHSVGRKGSLQKKHVPDISRYAIDIEWYRYLTDFPVVT